MPQPRAEQHSPDPTLALSEAPGSFGTRSPRLRAAPRAWIARVCECRTDRLCGSSVVAGGILWSSVAQQAADNFPLAAGSQGEACVYVYTHTHTYIWMGSGGAALPRAELHCGIGHIPSALQTCSSSRVSPTWQLTYLHNCKTEQ